MVIHITVNLIGEYMVMFFFATIVPNKFAATDFYISVRAVVVQIFVSVHYVHCGV